MNMTQHETAKMSLPQETFKLVAQCMVTEYLFFCPVPEVFAIEWRVWVEHILKPHTQGSWKRVSCDKSLSSRL